MFNRHQLLYPKIVYHIFCIYSFALNKYQQVIQYHVISFNVIGKQVKICTNTYFHVKSVKQDEEECFKCFNRKNKNFVGG